MTEHNATDRLFIGLADKIADATLRIAVPKIVDDLLQEIPVMSDLEEIGNDDWQAGYQQALHDTEASLKDRSKALLKRLDNVVRPSTLSHPNDGEGQ